MSSITITHQVFQSLSEAARTEIFRALGAAPAPAAASAALAPAKEEGKKKRVKKEVDPDAPPKEKRPPNAWIIFSGRVEKLIRAKEETAGTAKEAKMRTVVVKQFASALKSEKAYEEWTDADILEALESWTPPEKPVAEAPAEGGAAAAEEAPAAEAPAPKKRGPKKLADMTAEEKAAHEAKIAARKAKKAAEKAAGGAASEEE